VLPAALFPAAVIVPLFVTVPVQKIRKLAGLRVTPLLMVSAVVCTSRLIV